MNWVETRPDFPFHPAWKNIQRSAAAAVNKATIYDDKITVRFDPRGFEVFVNPFDIVFDFTVAQKRLCWEKPKPGVYECIVAITQVLMKRSDEMSWKNASQEQIDFESAIFCEFFRVASDEAVRAATEEVRLRNEQLGKPEISITISETLWDEARKATSFLWRMAKHVGLPLTGQMYMGGHRLEKGGVRSFDSVLIRFDREEMDGLLAIIELGLNERIARVIPDEDVKPLIELTRLIADAREKSKTSLG
jgi:hypothetical protein